MKNCDITRAKRVTQRNVIQADPCLLINSPIYNTAVCSRQHKPMTRTITCVFATSDHSICWRRRCIHGWLKIQINTVKLHIYRLHTVCWSDIWQHSVEKVPTASWQMQISVCHYGTVRLWLCSIHKTRHRTKSFDNMNLKLTAVHCDLLPVHAGDVNI